MEGKRTQQGDPRWYWQPSSEVLSGEKWLGNSRLKVESQSIGIPLWFADSSSPEITWNQGVKVVSTDGWNHHRTVCELCCCSKHRLKIPSDLQTEKDKYPLTSLICRISKEMIQINLQNRKRFRLREWTYGCGEVGGKRQLGSLGWVWTYCYIKMDNQDGPTVWHMDLSWMLCGSLDGRGVWGRMDTCVCMADCLHCSSETITTLLILNWLYPKTKQNIKKKKDEKKRFLPTWTTSSSV